MRHLIKQLTPPVVLSLLQDLRANQHISEFAKSGRHPFKPGYHEARWELTMNSIKSPERFARSGMLPERYGIRLDERVVEYPWFFSRLPAGSGKLLDAGSALNFQFFTELLKEKTVHIATLAPEANCYWQTGWSYLFADLRELPIRNSYYDCIACISTLEHVGANNERYTGVKEEIKASEHFIALEELWRVLKPGGTLYLTVPFGKPTPLDWFKQFNSQMIQELIEQVRPPEYSTTYYCYSPSGWNIGNEAEASRCEYTDPDAWFNADNVNPILPAAAGSVACLEMRK
jgi:SAM-dependent methyltransferase